MSNTQDATIMPWPRVHWNKSDLQWVAESLQVMNPLGFLDAESRASYIRNLAESELYKAGKPIDCSTGGWTVCFYPAWETLEPGRYDYVAVVCVTAYTAHRFAQNLASLACKVEVVA